MRTPHVVPALLMALTAAASTDPLAAQSEPRGWALRLEVARDAFTGASRDTLSVPGRAIDVTPAARPALDIGLSREAGGWEISLAVGYASGGLRARTGATAVEDYSGYVARLRAALLVGRRLAQLGSATLLVAAGPSIDHWRSSDIGNRTTIAGRAGLTLRVPLGPVLLENAARFGLGGSPWKEGDLPPGTELRALRTWSIGAGLVVPL